MKSSPLPTIILATAILYGCAPKIPDDDPTPVVEAEFDPSAEPSPAIPAPTDLIYDTTTGHLNVEIEMEDSDIARDLAAFLNSLDGWPASMPAKATFLGEIDPATITPDSVRVFDITDLGSPTPVEDANIFLEEENTELRIHPGRLPTWEVGHRYAIAILGGPGGVRGASGEEVVPSSTFWFFRSDLPLASCIECEEGLHDVDGDPWNGCEYPCAPDSPTEVSCEDSLDDDCDGRIDADDPDCSDRYPEFCNFRDDDRDLDIDEDFDVLTDPLNCGSCGNVCPERPCSTRTCTSGICSFECNPGRADTDSNPLNGCEDGCDDEPPHDLVGTCRSHSSLIEDEDAGDLEEVRSENEEVFDALELAGIPRQDIVLAWSFRTASQVVVPFDPSTDDVHFPNDYFMTDDETHFEVPYPEGSTPASDAILDRLNALDGYSLTAPVRIRFVGPLDGSSRNLTPTALLLMNADEDEDLPLAQRTWNEERHEVSIAPLRALHSHTRYGAIALKYLTDTDGNEITQSHIWTILKSYHPVIDSAGHSLISSVNDEDAHDLEEARLEYEELFHELEDASYRRPNVRVGVVFTAQTVTDHMQTLREVPSDESLSTTATSPSGVQDPADVVPTGYPLANLLGVVEGTIPALDLLDPTGEIDETSPSPVDLSFTLALPLAPPAGRTSAPVAIVQHDLGGSRTDIFAIADALAAEGWATIAIDLIGGADALLPVSNPFACGDATRQQAIHLVTLARSLRAADGPGSITGVDVDTSDISFIGSGFGAMAGTIFMAVDPSVSVCVLSGPGGNLGRIVATSSLTPGAVDSWLADDLGLAPGSEAHVLFRYAWSWAADRGDPGVFAHHLVDAPLTLPGETAPMEPKAPLLLILENDDVITQETQEFFFLSAGTEVYPEYFPASNNALLDIDDSDGARMRIRAVEHIVGGG